MLCEVSRHKDDFKSAASGPLGMVDVVDSFEDSVEREDWRSECARVYLTVVISSSSGVRKDTRFSAGNMGRAGVVILRGSVERAGLFVRMEARLWGCLYGIELEAD